MEASPHLLQERWPEKTVLECRAPLYERHLCLVQASVVVDYRESHEARYEAEEQTCPNEIPVVAGGVEEPLPDRAGDDTSKQDYLAVNPSPEDRPFKRKPVFDSIKQGRPPCPESSLHASP